MKTLKIIVLTTLTVVLVAAIFAVTFYIGSHSNYIPPPHSPPTVFKVKFRLGESLQSLQANSTYPINPAGSPNKYGVFGILGKPVIVENTDPEHGFVLPTSDFMTGGISNHKLDDIYISPHVGVLNLKDSITLIQHLMAIFKKAGWCQSKSSGNTKVEDLAMFFQDKNRDNAGIMSWRNGTQFTQLYMRRAFTANEMRSYYPNDASQWQDRFRLNLSIGNYPEMPDYLETQPCVD